MTRRREATTEEFARLLTMSAEYERQTGEQGFLHCYQPNPYGSERFAFGTGPTAIGVEEALARQEQMLKDARAAAE